MDNILQKSKSHASLERIGEVESLIKVYKEAMSSRLFADSLEIHLRIDRSGTCLQGSVFKDSVKAILSEDAKKTVSARVIDESSVGATHR